MNRIFVVQHEFDRSCGVSDVKFIGVFSSRKAAESAVLQLSARAGFSECPEGFSIDAYDLDHVHWAEGFVTK